MKFLIVEDEYHAAERLKQLISNLIENCSIEGPLESVEESVEWLNSNDSPDLIFMDIQLADGLSFSIFDQTELNAPIIFTTAFDQYSLKAFKVNSIDYLMKPIDESELSGALNKFYSLKGPDSIHNIESLRTILKNFKDKKHYKERFLLKKKDRYTFMLADEIAYFYSEDSISFIVDKQGKSHIYDATLNLLENQLNPQRFFRINRKQIIAFDAIVNIHNYYNNRIKLELNPKREEEVLVSRDKVKHFKIWLDQ